MRSRCLQLATLIAVAGAAVALGCGSDEVSETPAEMAGPPAVVPPPPDIRKVPRKYARQKKVKVGS